MCTDQQHAEMIDVLKKIKDQLIFRPYEDEIKPISETKALILDYKERRYLFIWSSVQLMLSLEDLGTLDVPANAWTSVSFSPGMRLFAVGTGTTTINVLLRATDENIAPMPIAAARMPVALSSASAASTGVATDAVVSWGDGTEPVTMAMIANNSAVNVNYEINAATTAGSDIIAPGQKLILTGLQITSVHLQAASNQTINGNAAGNIVVRGWA